MHFGNLSHITSVLFCLKTNLKMCNEIARLVIIEMMTKNDLYVPNKMIILYLKFLVTPRKS